MNKPATLAAILLAACATDVPTSVGPERGEEVGIDGEFGVTGRVNADGRVVLGNDTWVRATEVVNGRFAFTEVPDGDYFVKLEAAGVASATQHVTVEGGDAHIALTTSPLPSGFSYEWQRDLSRAGHEQGSLIGSARNLLRSAYGIELSDEELVWSDEHAARLLATMRAVPQPASSQWAPVEVTATTWILSDSPFARSAADNLVRIPASAFATGKFVSAPLHQAIVSDVTRNGADRAAVDRILLERYGVRAWLFSDAEMVALISMLEDMPAKLHAMTSLKTIIRREDGVAARATVAEAYLEIGAIAFRMDRAEAQYSLVREKARFLVTPALQTACSCDIPTAVADHVMQNGATVTGLDLSAQRPISRVAISTDGLQATVELGVTASSAAIYLFNESTAGYSLLSLDPIAEGVRGSVTLPRAGTWRPDAIIVRDQAGGVTVRDLSEVGWQLQVQ